MASKDPSRWVVIALAAAATVLVWAPAGCSSDQQSSGAPDGRGDGGKAVAAGGGFGAGAAGSASSPGPAAAGGTVASGGSSSGVGAGGAGAIDSSSGGAGGSASGIGGAAGATGSIDAGSGTAGPVAVDDTPGRWRTALDPATGRFSFITPDGSPAVLRGVSMTGLETGTRQTAAGAGFWLYSSGQGDEAANAPTVLENVVTTLVDQWHTGVVRIPICGSAWVQNYNVHGWGNESIATYRDWVDVAVSKAREKGAVVIIDNHLWAIAKMGNGTEVDRGTFASNGETHQYSDYEDGCTGVNSVDGTDSCAPKDWYTDDPNVWQCAIANADGVTIHNAYKNKDPIGNMWADIAERYKDDDGVWFEVYNEPYSRKATTPFPSAGENQAEEDYPWDLWAEFMHDQIRAIRDTAGASNMILVGGLDWGYDFGPEHGPIAHPGRYLPWASTYANIAYVFHPYQHGACCGEIGGSGSDLSAGDPYESAFCSYYPDGSEWGSPSGAALPVGETCSNKGYAATQDKKMPPCTWVDGAFNPNTGGTGLCAGDRTLCGDKTQSECESIDRTSPEAGGWSRHVLPMAKYGPLIATEFGSFDCSSAYVTTLLEYMRDFGISYTAWALWSQNSGGPDGLGSCGYPSVMTPAADPGDFRTCLTQESCNSLIQPLPWAGREIHDDIAGP